MSTDKISKSEAPEPQPAPKKISGALVCDLSGHVRPMTAEEHAKGVVKSA